MAESAERIATYEGLLQVPPHLVAEILAGRLFTHPRTPRHTRAGSCLGNEWPGPYQNGRAGAGGWWILDEPELHLAAEVVVPDTPGWRREHMPTRPETAWFGIAPDWACGTRSPSTARDDRVVKMATYARAGVGHLWRVDPDLRTLEVYGLESGRWVLLESQRDTRVAPLPFGAVASDLGDLWA